jgi:hypothetical protein
MDFPHEMATISHIMETMRMRKTDNEYRWTPEGLCACRGKTYQPHELEIVKVYRFEGITDPADMSIIYIIQANDGLIGYRLDTYGSYSNADHQPGYDNFMRMVRLRGNEEQLLFTL